MKSLKNWDNKTWLSSQKYIFHFNKFLTSQFKINRSTKILDIGCGRAFIISQLEKKNRFIQKPIGLDIVKNNNIKKNIIFKNENAINYLKNTKKLFDIILIKQTIHFFSKKQINTLLRYAKKKLNKKGKILIFLLDSKKNEIPCFDLMKLSLKKSLKKDQDLIKLIKKLLIKYKIINFSYNVKISKNYYIRMLKKRYISCLLTIDKKNLYKGIKQINYNYKKKISFKDKLICLIYKN